jgi:hypothetical protein
MKQVIIENPVLNSPYAEPRRHFRFTDDGITNEIVEGRRVSAYFVPVPQPRRQGGRGQQLSFNTARYLPIQQKCSFHKPFIIGELLKSKNLATFSMSNAL